MRRLLNLSIALAALVVLIWALQPSASLTATAARAPTPTAERPRAPAARSVGVRAERGRISQTTYRLDLMQRIKLGAGQPIEIGVTGEWIVTPHAGGEVTVRLAHAALTGPLPLDPAELERPMRLRAGSDGALTGVGFAHDPSPMAHRLLVGLASGAWFTPGGGPKWTAVEADRTGRYEAAYDRGADGRVTRTRTGYLALHGADGVLHSRGIGDLSISGQTVFGFDQQGLARVHQSERVVSARIDSSLGEVRPRAVADIELVLERIETRRVALDPATGVRFGPLKQAVDQAAMDITLDRNRVGDATVASLVTELSSATMQGLTGPDRPTYSRAMGRLAAALRLDPALAGEVADAARAASDPAVTSLLTGALGGAGTAEASAALAGLLDADNDEATRIQAIANLGRSAYAGPETVEAIEAQLDGDLDDAAAFALGTQSKRLGDDEPEVAQQAADALFDRFAEADSSAARRRALDALANSGDARMLPIVEEILKSDPMLASTAAYALRFVPGDAADDLLDGLLTTQNAPSVWQGAVKAIGFRDAERWQAPLSAALDEAMYDAETRALIERVLARNR